MVHHGLDLDDVNDLAVAILKQVYYKEDLTWMKGMGCYVWDTPEIVRAKKSYELQSEVSMINKRSIVINDGIVHYTTLKDMAIRMLSYI